MSAKQNTRGGNTAVFIGTSFVLLGLLQSVIVGQHLPHLDHTQPPQIIASERLMSEDTHRSSRKASILTGYTAFDEQLLKQRFMTDSGYFHISSKFLEDVLSYDPDNRS